MLKQAGRTIRDALAVAVERPYAKPGHFYSPLSSRADARRAVDWLRHPALAGVDMNEAAQLRLAADLAPSWTEPFGPRYQPGNDQYSVGDAAILRSMLEHHSIRRVLEVGSGHSTAVMLDAGGVDVTCVEPYPDRLLANLRTGDDVELLQVGAQDVPIDRFLELGPGDLLFIDSTHVLKPGSDVVWLYLHVLPQLQPGVLVHIHDIFWPFEYPREWLEQRRDWTELYLLRAMLTGTRMWSVELFSSWLWREHPDLIPESLRAPAPSNIWLQKLTG